MDIRLLFVDMEGTIFEKQRVQRRPPKSYHHYSLWSRLIFELGPRAVDEEAKTILKWDSGQYPSYLDWCDESVRILQKHGLTKSLFEKILDSVAYSQGAEETFEILHQRGIKTAIVSGGFIEQARRAQQHLKITHAYAAVDLFWDDNGALIHWNILPSDYEGKVDFVRLMMREYGLRQEECGFVGDGKNDVFIAQEVGVSFAYRAHPELRDVATHEIEDLTAILRRIREV